ncbi:MAG: hypothetical protein IIY94_07940 [Oscillospiraceae bacterium]|nr:hypothetical protein [Oscillospiraceae bacterium]
MKQNHLLRYFVMILLAALLFSGCGAPEEADHWVPVRGAAQTEYTDASEDAAQPTSLPTQALESETTAVPTEASSEATAEPEPSTTAAQETAALEPSGERDGAKTLEQTEPETTAGELEITYIANKNSKKFHLPDCSSVADMKESNKWEFTGSRDELIELGYQPCKRCNP